MRCVVFALLGRPPLQRFAGGSPRHSLALPPTLRAVAPPSSKIVKKGIDADDARRRRETRTVALRKEKREEGLEKRRRGPADESSGDSVGASLIAIAGELSLDRLGDYCAGALRSRARRARGCACGA